MSDWDGIYLTLEVVLITKMHTTKLNKVPDSCKPLLFLRLFGINFHISYICCDLFSVQLIPFQKFPLAAGRPKLFSLLI